MLPLNVPVSSSHFSYKYHPNQWTNICDNNIRQQHLMTDFSVFHNNILQSSTAQKYTTSDDNYGMLREIGSSYMEPKNDGCIISVKAGEPRELHSADGILLEIMPDNSDDDGTILENMDLAICRIPIGGENKRKSSIVTLDEASDMDC